MTDSKCYPRLVHPQEKEDREETGAIPELADVTGAELLDGVKKHVQRVWIRVYTLAVIRQELPLIFARWITDETRATFGALPLYINTWLANRAKDSAKEPPKPLAVKKGRWRDSGKECVPAYLHGVKTGFCMVHRSHEACAIEGRVL